jgi:hypothetical protein
LGIPDGNDETVGIAIDPAGNAHVGGYANEPGWPTTPDAYQTSFIGPTPNADAALTKLDALGETLVYSTWFGGSSSEIAVDIDLHGDQVYLASRTGPSTPVTPGAYQVTAGGSTDHHVAVFQIPTLPWRVLGGGLKGTKDVPILAGVGPLLPGSPTRLSLRGAAPSAPGWIVAGFSTLSLPLLGGTLVPSPDVHAPVIASPSGALELGFAWPALTPGTTLTAQVWFFDPGAPQGWSASNAVAMIGQ